MSVSTGRTVSRTTDIRHLPGGPLSTTTLAVHRSRFCGWRPVECDATLAPSRLAIGHTADPNGRGTMFDTPVTIIGNVLTTPEWRRTNTTGTMLVTFKVASTSRRYDKERGTWIDGASLRVRV